LLKGSKARGRNYGQRSANLRMCAAAERSQSYAESVRRWPEGERPDTLAIAPVDGNLRSARDPSGAKMGTNTQMLDVVALQASAADSRPDAATDEPRARIELALGTL